MNDPRRCSKCGADIEETYTERICQGCGLKENECECEPDLRRCPRCGVKA